MKRSIILYLIAIAIVAFSVVKIVKDHKKSAALKNTAAVVPVFPAEGFIVRDTLVRNTLNTIGTLIANERVDIRSEISQRVVLINFDEGSFIQAGALLFKLDDALLRAELSKLQIQEELELLNESRNRKLLEKGGISQQDYDEQQNHLKTIQAEIAFVNVQIDKTEVRAPFSGRIGLRNVSLGAFIGPQDILTVLDDVSRIKLDFSVPERYAMSVRQGQTVSFTLPGSPDVHEATIEALQPGIDEQTRSIKARAIAENPAGLFIPGYSVKVQMNLTEAQKSLYIPSQCLIPTLKGYSVYVIRNSKATLMPVLAGNRNEESVQILEGVVAGDTLIMTNLLRIRQGDKVKIVKTS